MTPHLKQGDKQKKVERCKHNKTPFCLLCSKEETQELQKAWGKAIGGSWRINNKSQASSYSGDVPVNSPQSPHSYLTDRVEAIYKTYVQAEDTHSECDDACSHKYYEKQNKIDFIKDVQALISQERERLLDYCEEWKRPTDDEGVYEKIYFISETDFKKALSDIGGGK